MNLYEQLKEDHKAVLSVLNKLVLEEDTDERRRLIEKTRDLLVPHSRAEEAVLYNVLRDMDEAKDLVTHSYEEHIKAETLLRALQVTEKVALNWKSGVEKLIQALSHHISQEEGPVFSAAHKIFSDEEVKALGNTFTQLKSKIEPGFLSSQMELMANLMPARFRQSFTKHLSESHKEVERKAS